MNSPFSVITSPRSILLVAVASLAMALAAPDTAASQTKLTDGWSIFIYGGVRYEIRPGYTVSVVYLPDGSAFVWIRPISYTGPAPGSSSPPPNNGTVLVSQAPDGRSVHVPNNGTSTAGTTSAAPWIAATPDRGPGQQPGATPAWGPDANGIVLTQFNHTSRNALAAFLDDRSLNRLQSDVEVSNAILQEFVTTGRISVRAFNQMRAASLRLQRDLQAALDAIDTARGHDLPDPQMKVQGLAVAADLVRNLEFLIPLMDRVENQVHSR